MKKPLNEEFKRMQKLAGINENEGQNVADFLNQHKEEVFEKMYADIADSVDGVNIDAMTDWEEYHDDDINYTCAQMDFPDAGEGAQARFTPFPPDAEGDGYLHETNIAGKVIYYLTFSF